MRAMVWPLVFMVASILREAAAAVKAACYGQVNNLRSVKIKP